jgi:hypothetical protein
MDAATIRAAAAALVRRHGGRLGLEEFAVGVMALAIEALPADEPDALIVDLRERIDGVVAFNGCGFWRTCSGCYESEDGYPNGHYPNSRVLQCTLGAGCSECGGIGATWDPIDYEEMAREMIAEDAAEAARAAAGSK